MTPEEKEQMNELCAQIQQEKDYGRFEMLLRDLDDLVRRKESRFPQHYGTPSPSGLSNRARKLLSGSVQKILTDFYANQSEKAEIGIDEAEHLFREIRIDNTFTGVDGQTVALKQGARVAITVEANATDTVQKTAEGPA